MDPLKRRETDRQLALLLAGWEMLRIQHREIPAQAVTVLLYVASHDPCHKQAVEEDHGLTTASCSRMVAFLCDGPVRPGVKTHGLGFVRRITDPSNQRRHLLTLTPKGERFVRSFKSMINGSDH